MKKSTSTLIWFFAIMVSSFSAMSQNVVTKFERNEWQTGESQTKAVYKMLQMTLKTSKQYNPNNSDFWVEYKNTSSGKVKFYSNIGDRPIDEPQKFIQIGPGETRSNLVVLPTNTPFIYVVTGVPVEDKKVELTISPK